MTSNRKIQANRANARLSTGAKTSHGRACSAKNAYRHGLSLPIHFDPVLSEEVETLARQIAGPGADAEIVLTRRIAEAQMDVGRVRYARHQLLSQTLRDPDYDSEAGKRQRNALVRRVCGSPVHLRQYQTMWWSSCTRGRRDRASSQQSCWMRPVSC